jgi:hypothetical protein
MLRDRSDGADFYDRGLEIFKALRFRQHLRDYPLENGLAPNLKALSLEKVTAQLEI